MPEKCGNFYLGRFSIGKAREMDETIAQAMNVKNLPHFLRARGKPIFGRELPSGARQRAKILRAV